MSSSPHTPEAEKEARAEDAAAESKQQEQEEGKQDKRDAVFVNSRVFYLEPKQLAAMLQDKEQAKGVLVVDVRDTDIGDTMIAGNTINVPAGLLTQRTLEDALSRLGTSLADYKTVVVHCMYSQVRGPRSARLINSFYPNRKFDLCVLRGGFCSWFSSYPKLLQPAQPYP